MRLSLVLLALGGAQLSGARPGSSQVTTLAPLLTPSTGRSSSSGGVLADKYIVKFKDGSGAALVEEAVRGLEHKAEHVFHGRFRGFAGRLDRAALAAMRRHAAVEYVEQDAVVSVAGMATQRDAPWGLVRISHRGRDAGAGAYAYDEGAGAGTCAYLLDTGVDAAHPDFGGRAAQVKSFVDGQAGDGHGHGTHVAGTVGGGTYGVAKKTALYGVKVLGDDGHGANSAIIAGLCYVAEDARARGCAKGVVANLSVGGPASKAVNHAARALVDAGVFVGVAAGNSNADAAGFSPASEPSVCTVGATARDDSRFDGSNWGAAVDVMAPGVDILSTAPGGGTARMTGTSMAAPHVVGLAAYLAALEGVRGGDALCRRIRDLATADRISNPPKDTVNKLAFNGASQGDDDDSG